MHYNAKLEFLSVVILVKYFKIALRSLYFPQLHEFLSLVLISIIFGGSHVCVCVCVCVCLCVSFSGQYTLIQNNLDLVLILSNISAHLLCIPGGIYSTSLSGSVSDPTCIRMFSLKPLWRHLIGMLR